MHSEAHTVADLGDRTVDPWALLTGGSIAIVAGFIADLLRLGIHEAWRLTPACSGRGHGATSDWQRPCPSSR